MLLRRLLLQIWTSRRRRLARRAAGLRGSLKLTFMKPTLLSMWNRSPGFALVNYITGASRLAFIRWAARCIARIVLVMKERVTARAMGATRDGCTSTLKRELSPSRDLRQFAGMHQRSV
jgi:hypothetical protein